MTREIESENNKGVLYCTIISDYILNLLKFTWKINFAVKLIKI